MEKLIRQFQTLGHAGRLDVFRLLMRRHPQAVASGEVAAALGLKANTCSVHLSQLAETGLIMSERSGTSVRYRVMLAAVRELGDGVMRDCCNNRPDLCATETEEMKTTENKTFNALFICTGNSARSIMAEKILNDLPGSRFRAYSCGIAPGKAPNPRVLALLTRKGHQTGDLTSKPLERFSDPDSPQMDFVFTVCDNAANEECPAWPGRPISAHWGMADPSRAEGSEAEVALAFQQAYGILRNRLSAFASLPVATLSRISLQQAVDDIGRMKDPL